MSSSAAADAEMPSPSSRWFYFQIMHNIRDKEGIDPEYMAMKQSYDQVFISLEEWCKKHAALEKAYIFDTYAISGLFKFDSPKTADNLKRLLEGALSGCPHLRFISTKAVETQEEFDQRLVSIVANDGDEGSIYYSRDGAAAAGGAAAEHMASPTAALAARYRGCTDDIIEKSLKSVAQIKHDGLVVETRTHTIMTHPTEVVTCVLPGLGDLNALRRAFTNLRLTCETLTIRCNAKLLIGGNLIEDSDIFFISKTPSTPLGNLRGDACIPVRAFMETKLELQFFTDEQDAQLPFTISYDVVTEQIEADAAALEAASKESSVLAGDIPPSEYVDREQIFEQLQNIRQKCQRDGSTPFYTVPLTFKNPVTKIRAFLPPYVEAAWLLLDFENHGLQLKTDETGSWSITFDTPINFSNIESAKLVFRVNRSTGSLNNDTICMTANTLNILRVSNGMAWITFAVPNNRYFKYQGIVNPSPWKVLTSMCTGRPLVIRPDQPADGGEV